MKPTPPELKVKQARALWMRAQKLTVQEPFGSGPAATRAAIEHLGYVQIDTINVIERCHHHILYNRIPKYQRDDLRVAQSEEKSVFEYWTHALSYVPTRDLPFFLGDMKRRAAEPSKWLAGVKPAALRKMIRTIKRDGAISIRDIDDDVLIEKDHEWASRKPSKKALQRGFYSGELVISERIGMLKKYELASRHFGWDEAVTKPKMANEKAVLEYLIERGLRSQGLISLDSIAHLDAKKKPALLKILEMKTRRKELTEITIAKTPKSRHWLESPDFDVHPEVTEETVHILSPFDPLTIQRKRLKMFFGYEHRFEAYLPKEKRVYGYFALPVLVGDNVVAAIDLKTDRASRKLLVQKWNWIGRFRSPGMKRLVEAELHRFEAFQLGN